MHQLYCPGAPQIADNSSQVDAGDSNTRGGDTRKTFGKRQPHRGCEIVDAGTKKYYQ